MRLVVGLLAVSLLGADGPKRPESPGIAYQINILEMNGLDWRSSLHAQLQPVSRQGAATIWTASRDTASKLAERAGRVIAAPKVVSPPMVRSTVHSSTTRRIVTEFAREADGPVNHASFVGFVPRVEDANEGYSVEVTGRKLDQGVIARIELEDRQITVVHNVPVSELVEPRAGKDGDARKVPVEVSIQVPEFARISVAGEWLIPKDGVLLVSLGAHTVADAKGKAVVRERLAVIAADAVEGEPNSFTAGPLNLNLSLLRTVGIARPSAIPLPKAAPAVPSRSLPQPFNASGEPVPLPPLPEEPATATTLPGSLEPCASPQTRNAVVAGEPIPWKKSELHDPASTRAGFPAEPPCCDAYTDLVTRKPDVVSKDRPFPTSGLSSPRPHSPGEPIAARNSESFAPQAGHGKEPVCCDQGCDEKDAKSVVAQGALPTGWRVIKFFIGKEGFDVEVNVKPSNDSSAGKPLASPSSPPVEQK